MDPKTKVFRTHRALAWLYGIIGLAVITATAMGPEKLDGVGTLVLLLFFGLLFALHMAIAKACLAGKRWGRIASIAVACLLLLAFPLGTLIGVYLLANCWKPWPEPAAGAKT